MACFIYIQVLLILLGNCYLLALEGVPEAECPQPVVKKRTIIRAKESRENGAEPIGKFVVDSARQCYSRCCKEASCNVAIMYYKQVSEDEKMEKHCFLFDCKSPSVCSYDNHDRYAVIEVPKPMSVKKTTPKKEHEEQCPPGAPVAMCSADPCQGQSCAGHPDAVCKPSFCGGCFAKFYNTSGKEIVCTTRETKKKNEEAVLVASVDYQETPEESLPGPASIVGTTKDPYFQSDRRIWIDGDNPGHLFNGSTGELSPTTSHGEDSSTNQSQEKGQDEERVIVVNNSFMSIPMFIALCICILLIVGLIYRFKFAARGKPKKVPVDDGDYLINGMYL